MELDSIKKITPIFVPIISNSKECLRLGANLNLQKCEKMKLFWNAHSVSGPHAIVSQSFSEVIFELNSSNNENYVLVTGSLHLVGAVLAELKFDLFK